MKQAIYITLLIIFIVLLSSPSISIKPFKIEFKSWMYGIGVALIVAGLMLIEYHSYSKGFNDCKKEVFEILDKYIDGKNK